MEESNFNDSSSACAIDALSILSKRSFHKSSSFQHIDNSEVDYIYSIIINGEASQSDLEDVSDLNILWCAIVLILKSNHRLLNYKNDSIEPTELAVHIQRFLGALFATFETVIDQQPQNLAYLIQSLQNCFDENSINSENSLVQMMSEYKSIFPYAYMFNRRTGKTPSSQIDKVTEYFYKNKQQKHSSYDQSLQMNNSLSSSKENNELFNDSDSYDNSFDNIINFLPPLISAPNIMPLKPIKILSDDEHYGSDYQPASASDIDNDLYDRTTNNHNNYNNNLNDDNIHNNENEVSILSSYYKYNGWNNIAEEDEDSDNNDGDNRINSYMHSPAISSSTNRKPKRITRMRASAKNTSITTMTTSMVDSSKTNMEANKTIKSRSKQNNNYSESLSMRSNNKSNNNNSNKNKIIHSKIVNFDESIEEVDLSALDRSSQSHQSDDGASRKDINSPNSNSSGNSPINNNKVYEYDTNNMSDESHSLSPQAIKTRWNSNNLVTMEDNKSIKHFDHKQSYNNNIINYKSNTNNSNINISNSMYNSYDDNKKSNKPRIKFRNPLDASLELNTIENITDRDIDNNIDHYSSHSSPYSVNNDTTTANNNIINNNNKSLYDGVLNLSVSDSDHSLSPTENKRLKNNVSTNNNNNNNNKSNNNTYNNSNNNNTHANNNSIKTQVLSTNKQSTTTATTATTRIIRLPTVSSPNRIRILSIDSEVDSNNYDNNNNNNHKQVENKNIVLSSNNNNSKTANLDETAKERQAKILKIKETIAKKDKDKLHNNNNELLSNENHLIQSKTIANNNLESKKPEVASNQINNENMVSSSSSINNNNNKINNHNNDNSNNTSYDKVAHKVGVEYVDDPSIDIPILHNTNNLIKKNNTSIIMKPLQNPAPLIVNINPSLITEVSSNTNTSTNTTTSSTSSTLLTSGVVIEDRELRRERTSSSYDQVLYGSPNNYIENNNIENNIENVEYNMDITRNNSNQNKTINHKNLFDKQFVFLPGNFILPTLSEYAIATGVIMEGFLQKKSHGIFGLWQKRYFVLSESEEYFCILRIYSNAIITAWGTVPIGLRASIPICAIESIEAVTTSTSKGKDFRIKFTPRISSNNRITETPTLHSTNTTNNNNNNNTGSSLLGVRSNSINSNNHDNNSDNGSVYSEGMFGKEIKETTLHADDAETRLLWMTFMNKAIHIALNVEDYV